MTFQLQVVDDVSINDLAALAKAGHSVIRSSHVGNQYGSNMALLSAGVPAVQYDRTLGGKDRNYHPHLVLKAGKSQFREALCHPEVLLSTTTVGFDHLRVLRRVFPEPVVSIEFHGDYLRRHEAKDRPILSILNRVSGQLSGKAWAWDRFVNDDSTVCARTHSGWQQIIDEGIYGVTRETYGWLMPNIFNVLLYSLFEALEFGDTRIHHLSGPSMIKYVNQLVPDVSKMWGEVAEFMGAPKEFQFCLYPTASARFVTVASRRRQLDELIDAYEALDRFRKGKGAVIKAAGQLDRDATITRLSAEESSFCQRLATAVEACPEVFLDITSMKHLTHHDADRHGLYVPWWTLQQPLARMDSACKEMLRISHAVAARNAA